MALFSLDLRPRIRLALQQIEAAVFDSRQVLDHGFVAWGEFIEKPVDDKQIGIFGTASAIQLMSLAPAGPDLGPALRALPGLDTFARNQSPFDELDLTLTLKSTSIVNAQVACRGELPQKSRVVEVLKKGFLSDQGWDFFNPFDPTVDMSSAKPQPLPTAATVIALSADKRLAASEELGKAAHWLAALAAGGRIKEPCIQAFALLALSLHAAVLQDPPPDDVLVGTKALRDSLSKWSRDRSASNFGIEYRPHYLVPRQDAQNGRNHYVSFPTDVVVARTLLEIGPTRQERNYVFQVVEHILAGVNADGGLRSTITDRVSLANTLAAHQALTSALSYCERFESSALRRVVGFFRPLSGRIVLLLGLLTVLVAATSVVLLSADLVWRVAAAVVGGVSTKMIVDTLMAMGKYLREGR